MYDRDLDEVVAVAPDEMLCACLKTLPMGWTHALFYCQAALVRLLERADRRIRGRRSSEAAGNFVLDGRKVGAFVEGRPLYFPYVDNANVWCASYACAKRSCDIICKVFDEEGFQYRVEREPADVMDAIGFRFDTVSGRISKKPERAWRIHFGLLALRDVGRCTP